MGLNAALQGKTYDEKPFRVEGARVRGFANAVGHPADDVPPTFVTVAEHLAGVAAIVTDADLGLDFTRVVHGEQEYEWHRPMRVDETLRASTTIESIRSKGGLEFLVLRTDLRDEAGEPVVIARSTLIVRAGR